MFADRERETSISLREYFSENTKVKPREREKEKDGEDRRWFLALGIIASGSESLTKAPNGGEGAGLTSTGAECRL